MGNYDVSVEVDWLEDDEVDIVESVLERFVDTVCEPDLLPGKHGFFAEFDAMPCSIPDGGEMEFAESLAKRLWDTLGRYVEIRVETVCNDDPPTHAYEFGQPAFSKYRRGEDVLHPDIADGALREAVIQVLPWKTPEKELLVADLENVQRELYDCAQGVSRAVEAVWVPPDIRITAVSGYGGKRFAINAKACGKLPDGLSERGLVRRIAESIRETTGRAVEVSVSFWRVEPSGEYVDKPRETN